MIADRSSGGHGGIAGHLGIGRRLRIAGRLGIALVLATGLMLGACTSVATPVPSASPAPSSSATPSVLPSPASTAIASARDAAAAVAATDERFTGIEERNPDMIGQGSFWEAAPMDPAASPGGWTVTYTIGWGDCPAGCIYEHVWTYRVDADGTVTLLSETGDPLGSDAS